MSVAARPRIEAVQNDAGWFLRPVGGNGEMVGLTDEQKDTLAGQTATGVAQQLGRMRFDDASREIVNRWLEAEADFSAVAQALGAAGSRRGAIEGKLREIWADDTARNRIQGEDDLRKALEERGIRVNVSELKQILREIYDDGSFPELFADVPALRPPPPQ